MLVQKLEQLLNEIRQRKNEHEFVKIQSAKESTMYGSMKKTTTKKKTGAGLSKKQKTLPKQLQQKIMKAKKKK